MLGLVLRRATQVTLGGTTALVGYKLAQSNWPTAEQLRTTTVMQDTSFQQSRTPKKPALVATSIWAFDDKLPNLLFGRKTDRRLPLTANSRREDAQAKTMQLLKDPTCEKWATLQNSDKDALYCAVINGWEDVAQALLNDKPMRVNYQYSWFNQDKMSILGIALKEHKLSMAKFLVNYGANVDTWVLRTSKNEFAPALPSIPALMQAVIWKDQALVTLMIQKDPYIITRKDAYGQNALFGTLCEPDCALDVEMIKLLVKLGVKADEANADGETFITKLDSLGHKDLAAELCRKAGHKCHHQP